MLIFALSDKREIVLVHFAGAKRPPADKLPKDGRHLAMAETGSLDPWRAKLRASNIEFWEEDHGDQQSLYFSDPNGITLEITSPPTAPELTHQRSRRDPRAEMGATTRLGREYRLRSFGLCERQHVTRGSWNSIAWHARRRNLDEACA